MSKPGECPAIEVARRLEAEALPDPLTEVLGSGRPPDYLRSDHRPEFPAQAVREWLGRTGSQTAR